MRPGRAVAPACSGRAPTSCERQLVILPARCTSMQAGGRVGALREAASVLGCVGLTRAVRDEGFGPFWHQVGEAVPKIAGSGSGWRIEWVPVLGSGGWW